MPGGFWGGCRWGAWWVGNEEGVFGSSRSVLIMSFRVV